MSENKPDVFDARRWVIGPETAPASHRQKVMIVAPMLRVPQWCGKQWRPQRPCWYLHRDLASSIPDVVEP